MLNQKIECVIPVLPVRNLQESINFYTSLLGFKADWGTDKESKVGSVSRDGHCIMLSEMHGERKPTWVWIGLHDDSLFSEYTSKGIEIYQKPTNQSYAYEMKIKDIDGNILWLGTEPKAEA